MSRGRRLVGVATALALVVGGCTGDDDPGTPTTDGAGATAGDGATANPGGATAGETAADDGGNATAATVAVAESDLGQVVVDAEGRTLYMFVPDEGGEPTCAEACAETWPVFEGPATAGEGVDGSLLATVAHPSGATQVTYGGWPLYYFASDASPGDTNGQGVNEVWFVVGADGEPIRNAAAAGAEDTGY